MKLLTGIAGLGLVLSTALLFTGLAEAATCSFGTSTAARSLCGNKLVQAADADVAAAFDAALKLTPVADQQAFTDYQGIWRDNRNTDCAFDDDGETAAKPKELAKCVISESTARTHVLSGLPEEGPGSDARIVPVIEHGVQGFIWSVRFADPQTPAEKLVNAKLDNEIAGLHLGTAGQDGDYSDDLNADLKYADPNLVSIEVDGSHYSPADKALNPFDYNLNVDMRSGKVLGFADAFAPEVLPQLQKQCIAQLGADFTLSDNGSDADVRSAEAMVADLSQWSFGAKQATITMDPGDEDPYQCHFGYGDLKKIVKADFPLPS